MAKRTPYRAAVIGDGLTDEQTTTYAMNSAIRTTEALVRALARNEGVMHHGGRPNRVGDVYTRVWTSARISTSVARMALFMAYVVVCSSASPSPMMAARYGVRLAMVIPFRVFVRGVPAARLERAARPVPGRGWGGHRGAMSYVLAMA